MTDHATDPHARGQRRFARLLNQAHVPDDDIGAGTSAELTGARAVLTGAPVVRQHTMVCASHLGGTATCDCGVVRYYAVRQEGTLVRDRGGHPVHQWLRPGDVLSVEAGLGWANDVRWLLAEARDYADAKLHAERYRRAYEDAGQPLGTDPAPAGWPGEDAR